MKIFNDHITIYNTFDSQFELLPRITFIYGKQNEITVERQKHNNGSPTSAGGFWNSEIYIIKN